LENSVSAATATFASGSNNAVKGQLKLPQQLCTKMGWQFTDIALTTLIGNAAH